LIFRKLRNVKKKKRMGEKGGRKREGRLVPIQRTQAQEVKTG
jgi:hypothetical protein